MSCEGGSALALVLLVIGIGGMGFGLAWARRNPARAAIDAEQRRAREADLRLEEREALTAALQKTEAEYQERVEALRRGEPVDVEWIEFFDEERQTLRARLEALR